MEPNPDDRPTEGPDGEKVRVLGGRVARTSGVWSARVHDFLGHLARCGFSAAPRPIGFDDGGREVLTFVPGEVGHYPLSAAVRGDAALTSAAALLRRLHDASAGYAARHRDGWMFPAREPVEAVCHGDFAPYNCAFEGGRAVGVFDFDGAHPGPRLWDAAYAAYRFAPMTAPANPGGFGDLGEQLRRARLFCDAYGLEPAARRALPAWAMVRLEALVAFMHDRAGQGDPAFQANLDAGHARLYRADIEHIHAHAAEFESALR